MKRQKIMRKTAIILGFVLVFVVIFSIQRNLTLNGPEPAPRGKEVQREPVEPKEEDISKRSETISFSRSDPQLVVEFPSPEGPEKVEEDKPDEEFVSQELATEAARQRAESRWEEDEFALGDPISCANTEGELIAYQYPIALGTDSFPETLSPPPAEEITEEDLRSEDLWGINDFWTIVVSARRVDYPVFVHYQGLPPLLVTYHKAYEVASELLETNDLSFDNYVTMGRPGDFYLFSDQDDRRLALDAHTLRDHTERFKKTEERREERPAEPTEEQQQVYQEQVESAWDEIESINGR